MTAKTSVFPESVLSAKIESTARTQREEGPAGGGLTGAEIGGLRPDQSQGIMPGVIMENGNRHGAHTNHDRDRLPNGVNGGTYPDSRSQEKGKGPAEPQQNVRRDGRKFDSIFQKY